MPIKPGSDTSLFNALLTYLHQQNALDTHFIEQYLKTSAALDAASQAAADFSSLADITDVSQQTETFFAWFRVRRKR